MEQGVYPLQAVNTQRGGEFADVAGGYFGHDQRVAPARRYEIQNKIQILLYNIKHIVIQL
jgi:hypothetical protein